MAQASFDPGGFYEFNLSEGAVRTRGGDRVLVVSDTVLAPLVSSAVAHGDLIPVRKLGRQIGKHVAQSLASSAAGARPETVLSHATGVLSVFGWGTLSLARWGDALVAEMNDMPELDEDHLATAALLGGLFSELGGREVACVPAGSDGRFILVDPSIAEDVWTWSREGDDLPTIVSKLEAP